MTGGVGVGTGVFVDERAGQGAIDEDGELAGGGGDGLGLTDADGQPAVEGAEGGLAADETHGGHAEDSGGAIGRRLGLRAEAPPGSSRPRWLPSRRRSRDRRRANRPRCGRIGWGSGDAFMH